MRSGDEDAAELVQAVAVGGAAGRAAETELCRRYAPRIRLYGLRHLGSDERAHDLVQTVLLALIEAARVGRIAELDKVDRFVLGTCRNSVLKLRAQSGRARLADAEELAALPATPSARDGLDNLALIRCLQRLDGRALEVVMLSFQAERGTDEIAAQLGTTAGNVRVLRHRAIAALRSCLEAA